jgi:hypothetical protein
MSSAYRIGENTIMSIRRRLVLTGILLTPLILAAAGGPAAASTGSVVPLPAAVKAQLDKYLGAGVVGDPVPSSPLLAVDAYLPPVGIVMSYRVLEEGEKARTETHKVEETTNPKFKPGWRYVLDPWGVMYFQTSSDGGAVIAGNEDRDNEVLSRFTPGQPLIIVGLKPGESRQVTVTVQVADIAKPDKITHKGSLTITYTHLGAYKVKVPAGSLQVEVLALRQQLIVLRRTAPKRVRLRAVGRKTRSRPPTAGRRSTSCLPLSPSSPASFLQAELARPI